MVIPPRAQYRKSENLEVIALINPSKARRELLHIIEALPEDEIIAVRRFAEFVMKEVNDPLLLALAAAPEDDEPWTRDDEEAVEEARQDIKKGRTRPLEEVIKEFGMDA